VLLGASAGQAIYGPGFRVGEQRGRRLDWPEPVAQLPAHHEPWWAVATVHPAAVLRSRQREDDYAGLVADLRIVGELLTSTS
jgi:DNA polymerase